MVDGGFGDDGRVKRPDNVRGASVSRLVPVDYARDL